MLGSRANIEIVKEGFETVAEIMIAVNLELAVIKGNKTNWLLQSVSNNIAVTQL